MVRSVDSVGGGDHAAHTAAASVAEIVHENHQATAQRGKGSSLSEGAGSAGEPPASAADRVGESAAAAAAREGAASGGGGAAAAAARGGGSVGEAGFRGPMDVQAAAGSGGGGDSSLPAAGKRKAEGSGGGYPHHHPHAQQQQQQHEDAGSPRGANTAAAGDRPSDADIIAFENAIRAERAAGAPLVGDPEPLAALAAEYAGGGAPEFAAKAAALGAPPHAYARLRRARGDGNCFFRAFLFAYLEGLVARRDGAERDRLAARLAALRARLTAAGYDDLVLEAPLELLGGLLAGAAPPARGAAGGAADWAPLSVAALEQAARADDVSNYLVFLLRLITSAEIKARAEFFAPFIMGLSDMGVDEFCARCVDPMGEESDHVQAVALTDALGVPARVAYLDRSAGPGVDVHDFGGGGGDAGGGGEPRVHLLYRPGHYDILYRGAA